MSWGGDRVTPVIASPLIMMLAADSQGRTCGRGSRHSYRPDPVLADAAAETMELGQIAALRKLLTYFPEDAALLTSRLAATPIRVPGIIATADRTPRSAPARAHQRMAELTGLEVVMWPGTTHGMHLERPDLVSDAVAQLSASLRTGPSR